MQVSTLMVSHTREMLCAMEALTVARQRFRKRNMPDLGGSGRLKREKEGITSDSGSGLHRRF